MAARLKEAFGIEPELVPKGRGIFDVAVDGGNIYSKYETGTFPDNETIVKKILEIKAMN